ncbi:MAG: cysteine hydrolase [Micrococcales bacterium]|nr:cysteine hydrolase [Micrococcales bacterium]HNP15684.1 cysteine hydrolase [Terrimesophilobacter sp.]
MTSSVRPVTGDTPWLVVIDMQVIFGDKNSAWRTPDFDVITPAVQRLISAFGENVIYTRFIAPDNPEGAWVPYYELWPFALDAGRLNDMADAFDTTGHVVIDCPTFGKWGPELEQAMHGSREMVLVGVSTDCCVISTAIPAADAGVHVRVVSDGCAGLSPEDHQRALDTMALFAPLIEITNVDEVLETFA